MGTLVFYNSLYCVWVVDMEGNENERTFKWKKVEKLKKEEKIKIQRNNPILIFFK